jgi:hypothetical protein
LQWWFPALPERHDPPELPADEFISFASDGYDAAIDRKVGLSWLERAHIRPPGRIDVGRESADRLRPKG